MPTVTQNGQVTKYSPSTLLLVTIELVYSSVYMRGCKMHVRHYSSSCSAIVGKTALDYLIQTYYLQFLPLNRQDNHSLCHNHSLWPKALILLTPPSGMMVNLICVNGVETEHGYRSCLSPSPSCRPVRSCHCPLAAGGSPCVVQSIPSTWSSLGKLPRK